MYCSYWRWILRLVEIKTDQWLATKINSCDLYKLIAAYPLLQNVDSDLEGWNAGDVRGWGCGRPWRVSATANAGRRRQGTWCAVQATSRWRERHGRGVELCKTETRRQEPSLLLGLLMLMMLLHLNLNLTNKQYIIASSTFIYQEIKHDIELHESSNQSYISSCSTTLRIPIQRYSFYCFIVFPNCVPYPVPLSSFDFCCNYIKVYLK